MSVVNVFFADGFEEIEALTVVDLLRRVNIKTNMVSVTGNLKIAGGHGIDITADVLFEDCEEADMIVLPGGLKGTNTLKAHEGLKKMIIDYKEKNKYLAAICAAPTVYGAMGILKDRKACCYPGMEDELNCGEALMDDIVIDDKFITSRGAGTAMKLALALIGILENEETARKLADGIVYSIEEEA